MTTTILITKKGLGPNRLPTYPQLTAAPPGQTKLDDEAAGRDAVLLAEGEPQAPAGICPLGVKGSTFQPPIDKWRGLFLTTETGTAEQSGPEK